MSQDPTGVPRGRLATDPVPPVVRTDVTHVVDHVGAGAVLPAKNRVQWGPIFAGLVTALTLFLLLTVLGLALGASVLDPANAGDEAGLWATIWAIVTTVVSFFAGGWIAAKSAAVGGSFGGLMNGLLVGAVGLLFVIYLTTSGLGSLFGALSSSVGGLINVASQAVPTEDLIPAGTTPEEAGQEAEQVADEAEQQAQEAVDQAETAIEQVDPQVAFEAVRNGALGTFFGMLLLIVSAGVGGLFGHNSRWDIWEQQTK